MVIITPETKEAKQWIDDNVNSEGWQWLGRGLVIDNRYADDLLNGMVEAGLTQEDVTVTVC